MVKNKFRCSCSRLLVTWLISILFITPGIKKVTEFTCWAERNLRKYENKQMAIVTTSTFNYIITREINVVLRFYRNITTFWNDKPYKSQDNEILPTANEICQQLSLNELQSLLCDCKTCWGGGKKIIIIKEKRYNGFTSKRSRFKTSIGPGKYIDPLNNCLSALFILRKP